MRDGAFAHVSEPPATVGTLGAVRSSWTLVCTQADAWPATSSAWSRTSVVPSALTETDAPAVAADQVAPPSADVSCW